MRRLIPATAALLLLGAISTAAPTPEVTPDRTVLVDDIIGGAEIIAKGAEVLGLARENATSPINLIIASPGGDIFTGSIFIAYIEAARTYGTPIRCYVPTLAASMAFQILLHCDERVALPSARLLWHEARYGGVGEVPLTEDILRDLLDGLSEINTDMRMDIYRVLGKYLPRDTIDYHMERETLHTAYSLSRLAPGFLQVRVAVPGLLETIDAILTKRLTEQTNGGGSK